MGTADSQQRLIPSHGSSLHGNQENKFSRLTIASCNPGIVPKIPNGYSPLEAGTVFLEEDNPLFIVSYLHISVDRCIRLEVWGNRT